MRTIEEMQEILFRAKRKDNGEWVEGYYLKSKYYEGGITHFIADTDSEYDDYDSFHNMYVIDPKTLCRFTGLSDKNGNRILENDIVSDNREGERPRYAVVRFGTHIGGGYGFYMDWIGGYSYLRQDFAFWSSRINTIGNIFDNADLLEVK